MDHGKVFNYLLNKKSVDVNAKLTTGQTLLHFATFQNKTELVKELVQDHSADIYAIDNSSVLVQSLAAYKDNLELVNLLDLGQLLCGRFYVD